jgi:LDH2 family malate/lactate/ureidoglycolate dehydrogenase
MKAPTRTQGGAILNKKSEMVMVSPEVMEKFMQAVLTKIGVSEADAQTVAEVLIEADKRGIPSHGCARFKPFYVDPILAGVINPKAKPTIVSNRLATAVVDANLGLGHPVGKFAMELAIEKAKQHGLGLVAVRNSNHYGIAAWYAMQALSHNMIGITGTNARPSVAPTRGVEPLFGTNPVGFAIPCDDLCPFVFDAATTIAQRGKIETYARLEKPLPAGWVVSEKGENETNAKQVLSKLTAGQAALLPIGGTEEELGSHKGFGFATIVEILSSVLQQGSFLHELSGIQNGKRVPNRIGHFFAAVDLSCFGEVEAIKKHCGNLLREMRSSKRKNLEEEILTAGLREHRQTLASERDGIPLDPEMAKDIVALQKQFELTQFQFPFDSARSA